MKRQAEPNPAWPVPHMFTEALKGNNRTPNIASAQHSAVHGARPTASCGPVITLKKRRYDPHPIDKETEGQRREATAHSRFSTGCLTPGALPMSPPCLPGLSSAASLVSLGPVPLGNTPHPSLHNWCGLQNPQAPSLPLSPALPSLCVYHSQRPLLVPCISPKCSCLITQLDLTSLRVPGGVCGTCQPGRYLARTC